MRVPKTMLVKPTAFIKFTQIFKDYILNYSSLPAISVIIIPTAHTKPVFVTLSSERVKASRSFVIRRPFKLYTEIVIIPSMTIITKNKLSNTYLK